MKFRKFTSAYNSLGSKRSQLKMYVSIVLLFFGFLMINAQNNHYYYYRGNKVLIALDKQSVTFSVFKKFNKNSLKRLNVKKFNLQNNKTNVQYGTIEYQSIPSNAEYNKKLEMLKNIKNIRTVSPNFVDQDGTKMGMSDYFYVKLKKPSDFEKLQQLAEEKKVQIVEQNEFMPLWYTLRCTENTERNTLKVANYFFETGWFASSSPDFLIKDDLYFSNNKDSKRLQKTDSSPKNTTPCANDPKFGKQWGLYNNSNTNIDINACEAWGITEGDGVTVAVLDNGIELTHIDLSDNISSISYDSETNSSPSRIYGRHGTYVSGIIGAVKDNNIQMVGVAPMASLISVSNRLKLTQSSKANGINWAWLNGADIINNSWGSSHYRFDIVADAIENALTKGRDVKGTVVVFASGNDNKSVSFPAKLLPGILTVGSINKYGYKSNFSSYGDELDVVAPGENIFTTTLNSRTDFESGTSMAAPHVSGVAALVLSVNPCLTAEQVNDIIEKTAQKIRPNKYSYTHHSGRYNGIWNRQMGYGLVDAYAAIQMAQQVHSPTLDLYIKDSPGDIGIEPNTITGRRMWRSPDLS